MATKTSFIAFPLTCLVALACWIGAAQGQDSGGKDSGGKGETFVNKLLDRVNVELKKTDQGIQDLQEYLQASSDVLSSLQSDLDSYGSLYNELKAAQDQAVSQGHTDEANRIADEWNNTHLPSAQAAEQDYNTQLERHQRAESKLVQLNARRLDLASQRTRIQLGASRIKAWLEEHGGDTAGIEHIFDGRKSSSTPVNLPDVPPVGPARDVTPPAPPAPVP
jgi:hypothetical protein